MIRVDLLTLNLARNHKAYFGFGMESQKANILYVYPRSSTFIERDISYLESEFTVLRNSFFPQQGWTTPFYLVVQFLRLIPLMIKCKVVVCQFAGHHSVVPSLLSKLFGKKLLVVASGTESANFPQIDYGNHRKKWLSRSTCFTMRQANAISPVHKSLVKADYTYSCEFPAKQGILNHCSGVNASFHPIPYGFDSMVFKPMHENRIPNSFVTMAFGIDQDKLKKLKGADLIIQVAPNFPNCTFVLIGAGGLTETIPDNVKILDAVSIDEVPRLLSSYEFYLQLSISEGFPNALGEAMLCGCIPIGSNVTSIPEIISDTGFLLKTRDLKELEGLIESAIASDKVFQSTKARKRIQENYPANRRREELVALVTRLVND